jgi:hypothetical protein
LRALRQFLQPLVTFCLHRSQFAYRRARQR